MSKLDEKEDPIVASCGIKDGDEQERVTFEVFRVGAHVAIDVAAKTPITFHMDNGAAADLGDRLLTGARGPITPGHISARNEIGMYFHCRQCFGEKPDGQSMKQWARLEVGYTKIGLQVRCVRHGTNLIHLDFEGHKFDANTSPTDVPESKGKAH
jgi:hypothetical protein